MTLHARVLLAVSTAAVLTAFATRSGAQAKLTARLDASGLIRIMQGNAELAQIELNAHGPQWKHAPQETATAEVSDLDGRPAKQVVGSLPIPNTTGGAVRFTETVEVLAQALQIEYDLSMAGTMRLNGLQVSVILPVDQYAGQELEVPQADDETQIVGLPKEAEGQGTQLWFGEGARVEVAKGTPKGFTIELRGPTDVVAQDLRQWERSVFEVRFPAIMEDGGREMTAEDRFHLDLSFTFPEPLTLIGP
jgi:hypothetical protein